jgi:hypothetical protein
MIIVRPMGGMGNQMYALALGLALAEQKKAQLFLDKSWVKADGQRRGLNRDALEFFDHQIAEWPVSRLLTARLISSPLVDKALAFWAKLQSANKRAIFIEKECCFDSSLLESRARSIYVRGGTWQSYRYFEKYSAQIRRAFVFKEVVRQENQYWVQKIQESKNPIFVHVRRGDYVNNPSAAYTQGICTVPYYQNALEYFRKQIASPTFFFFSDDIEWVMHTFGASPDFVFVQRRASRENESGFRDDGHNDMYCMSQCCHGIVANSTFSWWAAWLIEHPEKVIVAPTRWYQGIGDDGFIIPDSWKRLDG